MLTGSLRARAHRFVALATLACGGALLATPAAAWWRGGVWIGVPVVPPVVVAPPVYYPPYPYYPPYYPYYPPPPPAATPVPPGQSQGQDQGQPQNQSSSQAPVAYGATCYAGVYTCPAQPNSPVGTGCSCPGIGAPSFGSVN